MASRPQAFVLDVTFEPRDDGGLRAYCDKVPSFVLSHSDAELVRADVVPALETILSAMYAMPMSVTPASDVGEEAPSLPPHICHAARYVGISEAA